MGALRRAVGPGMPNDADDVRIIDQQLERWERASGQPPTASSSQPVLARHVQSRRVERFQREVLGDPCPSGVVKPGDRTAQRLEALPKSAPTHFPVRPPRGPLLMNAPAGTPLSLPPLTDPQPLSDDDYEAAAKELGCEALAIKAVSMEEGKGRGFDAMGYPVILFEPINFASFASLPKPDSTFGRIYRRNYWNLTHKQPSPHPFGTPNHIWQRLETAYMLDPVDALQATSWGRFQLKGRNALGMGYCSVEDFVSAMCRSEGAQLNGFVNFIRMRRAQLALREHKWDTFAALYNGADYAAPAYLVDGKNYAERIGEIYERLKAPIR